MLSYLQVHLDSQTMYVIYLGMFRFTNLWLVTIFITCSIWDCEVNVFTWYIRLWSESICLVHKNCELNVYSVHEIVSLMYTWYMTFWTSCILMVHEVVSLMYTWYMKLWTWCILGTTNFELYVYLVHEAVNLMCTWYMKLWT